MKLRVLSKTIIAFVLYLIYQFVVDTTSTLVMQQTYLDQMEIDSTISFYYLTVYENITRVAPHLFGLLVFLLFLPEILYAVKKMKKERK